MSSRSEYPVSGVDAGYFIGKRGFTIKDIARRSGARLKYNKWLEVFVVKGSAECVQDALGRLDTLKKHYIAVCEFNNVLRRVSGARVYYKNGQMTVEATQQVVDAVKLQWPGAWDAWIMSMGPDLAEDDEGPPMMGDYAFKVT